MLRQPAESRIRISTCVLRASSSARAVICNGFWPAMISSVATSTCMPSCASCSRARRDALRRAMPSELFCARFLSGVSPIYQQWLFYRHLVDPPEDTRSGRRSFSSGSDVPQRFHQRVMHDLDDLLAGRDGFGNIGTNSAFSVPRR